MIEPIPSKRLYNPSNQETDNKIKRQMTNQSKHSILSATFSSSSSSTISPDHTFSIPLLQSSTSTSNDPELEKQKLSALAMALPNLQDSVNQFLTGLLNAQKKGKDGAMEEVKEDEGLEDDEEEDDN
ncbi:hypothetical protein BKA69DRAFT_1166630 [Paraphysoderma sedebokerense]|nr:hypothetical protein BKA69DRAFT_1166630 [Paraphysoderma sedebokerense]